MSKFSLDLNYKNIKILKHSLEQRIENDKYEYETLIRLSQNHEISEEGKIFIKEHEVFSIDWYVDIAKITAKDIIEKFGVPDVIWASPDCTTFSVVAISHHRRKEENGNLAPISEYAKFCDKIDSHVIELIKELNPKYYFIENPREGMRKMWFMSELPRYTVTYCQYGYERMKSTGIWTNHPNPEFKPMCHNGDKCHVANKRLRGDKWK